MRPANSTSGAPPSRSDTGPGSSVADMAITRRSSRRASAIRATSAKDEVGLQPALVQLVEDHAADALERRIVLQHAQEQAVGHDLDARARADLAVEPHAIAHRLADRLAERRRHAPRRRARGQPARLLHDDLATPEPRRIEQRQRHARRLAGAGRGDQHGGIALGQHRLQARQALVDGEGLHCWGL